MHRLPSMSERLNMSRKASRCKFRPAGRGRGLERGHRPAGETQLAGPAREHVYTPFEFSFNPSGLWHLRTCAADGQMATQHTTVYDTVHSIPTQSNHLQAQLPCTADLRRQGID